MRKSRVVVKDIDEEMYTKLASDAQAFFSLLEALEIQIPAWSVMMFAFTRTTKRSLDVSFFEDAKDFFLWYSKVLIDRKSDLKAASFNREPGKDYRVFAPPTLIGVDLQTRLRF